jgi:hypothetical protein
MRNLRGWNAVVAASAAVVVLVVIVSGIWWLVSVRSPMASYSVMNQLTQVDLQLSSGDAAIVGSSSPAVQVRRTDSYSFGHSARERRWVRGGVLHITSRCPRIVLGSCSASYELAIPEGVTVHVRTQSGAVSMTGFNGDATVTTGSGDVDVEAYCGFHLSAASGSGNLHVATACTPQSLKLLTGSGDATALVPPGRYRIAATSGERRQRVTGVKDDPTAPFTIVVNSARGAVAVEGGL